MKLEIIFQRNQMKNKINLIMTFNKKIKIIIKLMKKWIWMKIFKMIKEVKEVMEVM